MPVAINPIGTVPPFRFPYRFGPVEYFLTKRTNVDPHIWVSPDIDGGVVVGPNLICTPAATAYDQTCVVPSALKSDPVSGVRPAFIAEAQWFEVALEESTFSCPDLEPLARQSLLATIEHYVEGQVLDTLLASSIVLAAAPSYQCALSAAVQQAGAVTNSDGRAVIFVPPALAAYALSTHYLSVDADGHLVDAFGNWFVVLKGPDATRLFVVNELTAEVFLSDVIIDEISSVDRSLNTKIVRAEQGVILVFDACDSFAIDFVCAP